MLNHEKSNKRTILFFCYALHGGGAERALVELINHLNQTNYKPVLFLFKKEGPYLNIICSDVEIVELKEFVGYKRTLKFKRKLMEIIDHYKPHLLVSTLTGTNRTLLRALFFIGGKISVQTVVIEQNNLTAKLKLISPIKRLFVKLDIKFLYGYAKRIVAVSKGIKEDLVNNYNFPQESITVIHNPVLINEITKNIAESGDDSPLSTGNDYKTLVAVGRLVEQKAYPDLLEAFSMVCREVPSKLTILGEGPLRTKLNNLIEILNLKDHVEMPGFVENPWRVIADADLFVSASHWEGHPLSTLEALACGTAAVVTDCDFGPREIIQDGKNGMLVPVGEIDAMHKKIVDLLKNDELRKELAMNARQRAWDFDISVVNRKYEELIEELIDNSH